jgi:hypothetical protein
MAPLPETLLSFIPRSLLTSTTSTINLDPRTPSDPSPIAIQVLHRRLSKRASKIDYGAGVQPATDINNIGFQVLFALIGVGMVIASIWFFFWAKNGGFVWRKDDWDDYKSTVLRRKGPNGTTLSNATKSTKLGGGSVVHGGSYGNTETVSDGYTDETATSADTAEMREVEAGHRTGFGIRGGDARKHRKESSSAKHKDPELREYRHEKAARVGGLNRQHDGTYHDYSNSSDISTQPLNKPPKDKRNEKKAQEKRAKEAKRSEKKNKAAEEKARKEAEKASKKEKTHWTKPSQPCDYAAVTLAEPVVATSSRAAPVPHPHPDALHAARRAAPSAAYSFVSGDDTNTVYTGAYTAQTAPSEADNSYYSSYRPNAQATPPRRDHETRSASNSRHSSPRKYAGEHRSSRRSAAPSDIFSDGTQDTGTKSYPCYIPGLSAGSVGVSDSVSQAGGHNGERSSPRKGRDVMDGYRRGGVRGRRDSLSDSDS